MGENRFENVKKEVRSVLISSKGGLSLQEFIKLFRGLLGYRFPTREFGYTTDADFINSMPDVVCARTARDGSLLLYAIADETTEHIQKLVEKQKTVKRKPNNNHGNAAYSSRFNRMPTSYGSNRCRPFVPAQLRAEIIQIVKKHPNGIGYSALVSDYVATFSKQINLEWLSPIPSERFRNLAIAAPELEVKTIGNMEKLCLLNNHWKKGNDVNVPSQVFKPCSTTQISKAADKNSPSRSDIPVTSCNRQQDTSSIPSSVKQNFEKVLKHFPAGVLAIHFPALYQMLTHQTFDLYDFGYTSLLELADALPDIFFRLPSPKSSKDWILFHVDSSESARLASESLNHKPLPSANTYYSKQNIPSDIAPPTLKYIESELLKGAETEFIPLFISSVISPSLFWFQLQTEEALAAFKHLENEMENFYHSQSSSVYRMADADISVGAACVTLSKDDDQCYRVTVTSVSSTDSVIVYFVDYGSWEEVPRSSLYYLRYIFMHLPALAHKAQLAAVKPVSEKNVWTKNARHRFIDLCNRACIMAQIDSVCQSTISMFLCDCTGETDVHINDVLVKEGHAEYYINECNYGTPPSYLHQYTSESDSSSPSPVPPLATDEIPKSNNLNNSRLVNLRNSTKSFTPRSLFYEESKMQQRSIQRYIRRVTLGDGYSIHIILVNAEAYVSDGDLCNLFWKKKGTNFLADRLKLKEVVIPSISVSKERFGDLFEKCERYSVKGFCESRKNDSVTLYPLKQSVKILNTFGHPSEAVRKTLCKEIKSFDPNDAAWNEPLEELQQFEEYDCDNSNKLNRLCVYDLKTLLESLRYKRLKLMDSLKENRNHKMLNALKDLDATQNFICKRIKEIEEISSNFS